MVLSNEDELKQKIQDGYIVESREEMTEGYRKALIVQLTVQADTELMSAPAYWMAARHAPSTNTQVSAHAIIQDELAHANIAYRLLEDIGESKEQLVYGRQPHEFKHPYGFDQPLDNWADLVVANGFFDRAGITLLSDVYQNTSYGPLKRALYEVVEDRLAELILEGRIEEGAKVLFDVQNDEEAGLMLVSITFDVEEGEKGPSAVNLQKG
jgi:ring-1,2-phenylacetyl-CoA epoxidase subunit PaaA